LWPIQFGILGFLGFQVFKPNVVFGPARMSDAQRAQALALYRSRLATLADETPIKLIGGNPA